MDFAPLVKLIGDLSSNVVCLALLVWIVTKSIPARDKAAREDQQAAWNAVNKLSDEVRHLLDFAQRKEDQK